MLLFLIACPMIVEATPSHPQYTKPSQTEKNNYEKQQCTDALSSTIEAPLQQKSEAESASDYHTKCEKARIDGKLVEFTGQLALYTGLLFLATLALAVATAFLVRVGFRQIKDATRSIDAAVKSAQAAEKAADVAERALSKLENPYPFPIIDYFPDGPEPTISVSIKNYGRSPATIDKLSVSFRISTANVYGSRPDFALDKKFMTYSVVGVGETSEAFYIRDKILAQYKALIASGKKSLYVEVSFGFKSLMGLVVRQGMTFIWHWRFKRFVYGVQLWDELGPKD